MNIRCWTVLFALGLFVVGGSGCCCVSSYCNAGSDFGGAGCNSTCGASRGEVFVGQGGCGGNGGSCGGGCGECSGPGTMVGRFDLGAGSYGCGSAWNAPQFFVDRSGSPCLGPVFGVFNAIRNVYKGAGCGCGETYVDEWINDPPDCNDPCGDGCHSCGSEVYGGIIEGGCESGGCGGVGGCDCAGNPSRNALARRNYDWGTKSRYGCQDGKCELSHRGGRSRSGGPTTTSGWTQSKTWGSGPPPPELVRRQPATRPNANRSARRVSHDQRNRAQAKPKPSIKSFIKPASWFN